MSDEKIATQIAEANTKLHSVSVRRWCNNEVFVGFVVRLARRHLQRPAILFGLVEEPTNEIPSAASLPTIQ